MVDVSFSVIELKGNDTSGNKESGVYCQYVTFNGIYHSTKDLLN